ncbi:MAG: serine--tRNA ligase, partial [Paludibacteraceae bacterium]|nr:serine--tRNA ligase [Paludibacteraceae bacterium]
MLTLKQIYDGKEAIIAGLEKKHFNGAHEMIESVIAIDQARKAAQQKKDAASAEMNRISKSIGALMAQGKREEAEAAKAETATLKENIKALEVEMEKAENDLTQALLQIPNVPYAIVPEGRGAEDNVAVKVGGWNFGEALKGLAEGNRSFDADGNGIALRDWPESEDPKPEFAKLPHWELAKKYNLIDFDLGVKISGAGFPVYIGQGARLQRALINFFLAEANKAGYTEIMPPTVVNQASGYGTGQLPDKEGQMYHCEVDDLYLIPTAEVPVTNLYRDEIIDEASLPIKNCAYT